MRTIEIRRGIRWIFRFSGAFLCVFLWSVFSETITGSNYEFAIHDAMVRFRGVETPPDDVVVVSLDEESYRVLDLPLDRPLPRAIHGRLLKRLSELGAQRVVFDIVFAGKSASPEGDAALAEGVKSVPTVLGVDHETRMVGKTIMHEMIKPDPFLRDHAAALGLVGVRLDSGIARHFFTSRDESTADFPGLSEAGAGVMTGRQRKNRELPTDRDLIRYYGPARHIRNIPLYQVLEEQSPLPKKFIQNKVVFVGLMLRTEIGVAQKDSFGTPFGTMYGVEIHATEAANIINHGWIRRYDRTTERRMVGALLLFCSLLVVILRPQWSLLATCGVVSGWFVASYLLFQANFFLGGASAVTIFLPGLTLVNTSYWYVRAKLRQAHIEKAFSLYVAPAMVSQLKQNPGMLKLGGEEIVATAMFTDIAGFTGITEELGAVRVTSMLNLYFTDVSDVLMEEGGTVIKFIGDAVFALWNAPVRQEDHAVRAMRAALRLQEAVEGFNKKGLYPPLVTRVGLNTGKMVVGNLGSSKRFDFTAIGDSVNLASRVEGVNKYLGSVVLVTDDTLKAAGPGYHTLRMGSIRVVGKEQPVDLHRLLLAPFDETLKAEWNSAVTQFAAREFETARGGFEKLHASCPDLATACELYLEIIAAYDTTPPPDAWRGEITLEHK